MIMTQVLFRGILTRSLVIKGVPAFITAFEESPLTSQVLLVVAHLALPRAVDLVLPTTVFSPRELEGGLLEMAHSAFLEIWRAPFNSNSLLDHPECSEDFLQVLKKRARLLTAQQPKRSAFNSEGVCSCSRAVSRFS